MFDISYSNDSYSQSRPWKMAQIKNEYPARGVWNAVMTENQA